MYLTVLIIAVKMIFSTNLNIHTSLSYLFHSALKISAIQLESLEERFYSHREKFLIISIKIIPTNQSIQTALFYLLRKFDKNNKKIHESGIKFTRGLLEERIYWRIVVFLSIMEIGLPSQGIGTAFQYVWRFPLKQFRSILALSTMQENLGHYHEASI